MIHPNTELQFISPEKGFGVVATKLIPKGTITWVQDRFDQIFSPSEVDTLEEHYRSLLKTYSFRNNLGQSVLCWDHARFVNHSFNPTCITTAYDFELAVRDIFPGDELTDDYGFLNIEAPFNCLPEKGTQRTQVLPDDLLRYHTEWDQQLIDAFQYLYQIDQPLMHLVPLRFLHKIDKFITGEGSMDSILNCFYQDERNECSSSL